MNRDDNINFELLARCDEILDLYQLGGSGNKNKLIGKSKSFFEILVFKFLGKRILLQEFRLHRKAFYDVFDKCFVGHNDILHNEIDLAIDRLNCYSRGDQVCKFGIDHTVRCIDWVTCDLLQLKSRSFFAAYYSKYLISTDRFFKKEESESFSGRVLAFYRNAYRAEAYTHRVYSDADSVGWCDMYTPIILIRMAMEQYVKILCNKHGLYDKDFNEESKFNLKVAISRVRKAGLIDGAMKEEMDCVRERGNANTHSAEPAFLFANLHGLGLLAECYRRIIAMK